MLASTLSSESVEAKVSAESRRACSLAGDKVTRGSVAPCKSGVERKFMEPPCASPPTSYAILMSERKLTGPRLPAAAETMRRLFQADGGSGGVVVPAANLWLSNRPCLVDHGNPIARSGRRWELLLRARLAFSRGQRAWRLRSGHVVAPWIFAMTLTFRILATG